MLVLQVTQTDFHQHVALLQKWGGGELSPHFPLYVAAIYTLSSYRQEGDTVPPLWTQ